MLYIEIEFIKDIDIDSHIDEFYVLKSRMAQVMCTLYFDMYKI